MTGWIGRTVSKVEIEELLGKGGMAEVYKGLHSTLKRPVAVKFILSHLADDPELLTRFSDEAQQVAGLRHSNIVQVLDYDVVENTPYMVMEYIEGVSLSDYLKALYKRGEILTHEMTAQLIQGVADALDYAHQRGIIHRDVKPANVMLRAESGQIDVGDSLPPDVLPVLTDFGVARMQNVTAARTSTGALIGTPTYMSPEQVQGLPVDARSDVYSLGVMLYEMLAGKTPFDPGTDTPATILFKQVLEEPPPLEEVSPEIQAVIDRALAKDPDARYQKAGELAAGFKEAVGIPVDVKFSDMPTSFAITTQPMKIPRATGSKLPFGLQPRMLAIIGGAAGVVILVAILAIAGVFGGKGEEAAEEAPSVAEEEEAPAEAAASEVPRGQLTAANARDVQQLAQFSGASQGARAMRVSPNGDELAVFGVDGVIRVYDIETHSEKYSLQGGHSGPGFGLAYSPDGKRLASGGEDFRFVMWDLENQTLIFNFVANTNPTEIVFAPDGSKVVYVGTNNSRVFVIDADGNEAGVITEHSVVLGSVDVSPDGALIASGNSRGNVVISQLDSLATVTTLNDGAGTLLATKFSPDGKWLAIGSGNGSVWLYDTSNWQVARTWEAQANGVRYMAWSPDSSLLVTGGAGGSVTIWDPTNGRELNRYELTDGAVWMVDFARDGSFFATLSDREAMVRTFGFE